jgi:hypothetical protein
MKLLTIIVAVAMAVFTAVSIFYAPDWVSQTVLYLGRFNISTFDLLFFAGAGLFLIGALDGRTETVPANRLVLSLCWAYVAYQLVVVLPAAVLLHDLRVIDVFRQQEVRLSVAFIPLTYTVILRYWRPAVLVAIVDAAAAGLAVWVIYRYMTHGAEGYVESGVFRLRVVWGGGVLLFGWLMLTSFFYWPTRIWRLVLAGIALAGFGLANHRAGIVAFLTSFGVVLAMMRAVSKRVIIAFLLVALMSVGVFATASATVRDSLAYSVRTSLSVTSDQTAKDRLTRSALGLTYFEQHPLGDYVWNQRFYDVNLGEADFVPHNFVVQILVTQGAVAGAFYFAIIIATLAVAWRNRSDRLSGVMLAYLVFYLTFCLLDANIDLPENICLFYVAVAVVLHQNRELRLAERVESSGVATVPLLGESTHSALREGAVHV